MRTLRLLGLSGALVAAALVGGTVLSAAIAATPPPAAGPAAATPPTSEVDEYCQTFRAAFAANLGKTEDEVVAAAKAAIDTTIDAALADGKLTAAQADRLKARVAAAPADGCGLLKGWRWRVTKAAIGLARDGFTAAADALGMSAEELRTALRSGSDLKTIAAAHGVPYETVTMAIVDAVKADLDAAVAKGTITQEREDRVLDRLERRLADGTWRRAGAGQGN
jgi:hypothetical protein